MLKVFYLILLSNVLIGCYGLRNSGGATVDGFVNSKPLPIKCAGPIITAKKIALNTYYGFPSIDRINLIGNYSSNGNNVLSSNSTGLVGLRIERWITPNSKFPFRIIGLGLDYSFNKSKITYNTVLNPASFFELNRVSNHLLGSINIITFLRSRVIGYFTIQGGIVIQKNSLMIEEQNLVFDYRVGYGFQYYIKNNFGIALEGGYKGGAFVKAGIVFWPL